MSNLNLPTLTFDAIKAAVLKGRSKTSRKIMNNTDAYLLNGGDKVVVHHHGSAIAILTATSLYLTNAGYGSQTTRERLNGFLSSNNTGVYLAQRQGHQVLFERETHQRVTADFDSLRYDLVAQEVTEVNEQPVI